MARIQKNDLVKIITGDKKGTTAKVFAVDTKKATVLLEGIGQRHRHIKPSATNPRGGHKDIHVGMDISKVALVVDEKTSKTSRVGYQTGKNGEKIRVAKSLKNKEIK
ncbi:MAG: 50S ribosomal protein L24 [Candidatus Saccharimonadales bacterium]